MNGARNRGASNGIAGEDVAASRAAMFEDEKRRIIESCFTKRESDGTFAESYITHIRVTEDSTSPSSPPPPSSAADNKKSRAIIVAVKRSGRVRLHKARENPQGTFSIGKTWVLDDLSAIESYTGSLPTTDEEYRMKDWAGNTGVLLTIQKPYFWQIATQKEKDFFVGSLIKIYRKYTKGREPRLSGFTNQELSSFGVTGQPPPLAPQRSPAPPEPSPYASPSPVASPFADRNRARDLRPPSADSNRAPSTATNMRSPSAMSRFEEQSYRYQYLRKDPVDSFRSETPEGGRSASVASKQTFDSREEPSTQETLVNSALNERPKANGAYSAYPRSKDGSSFGRPPESPARVPSAETSFQTRPKSPERRPGVAERKASGSSIGNPPERRRPPLATTTTNSTTTVMTAEPQQTEPPPLVTESKAAPATKSSFGAGGAAGFFTAAAKKMQEMEASRGTGGDAASDTPTSVTDISKALDITSPADSITSPEEYRPGLGPMIRKKKSAKEIANTFRKAANAANAFKPRAGGAADRLAGTTNGDSAGGDGITGVFVARPREPAKPVVEPPKPIETAPTIATPDIQVTATTTKMEAERPSTADTNQSSDIHKTQPSSFFKSTQKLTELEIPPAPEKRKILPDRSAYYAKLYNCDVSLFEGKTSEVDAVFDDYGFGTSDVIRRKNTEDIQSDIKRDLAKLETGNWLSVMEAGDERVAHVSTLIDSAIAECDVLDGLLTLYNVELGTLAEDVAYIEAQSQGLQVMTANQRLLQTELQNLLETITIPEETLQILDRSIHDDQDSLADIGDALVHLYKAMLTIDPSLQSANGKEIANGLSADVSNMRAVMDQKEKYSRASLAFVLNFNDKMTAKFRSGQNSIKDTLAAQRSQPAPGTKIDHAIRNQMRNDLLYYSPIVLFEREVKQEEHLALLSTYAESAIEPYREQFRSTTREWQKDTKQSGGSDEVLFTTQEKEPETGGMARKLTVKRSKTVIKPDAPRGLGIERDQSGKIEAYIAFNGALIDLSQAVIFEQNFITEFFHLHSGQDIDFPELVNKAASGADIHTNLIEPRGYESDRDLAKIIKNAISQVFPEWERLLRTTIDQILSDDILNAFGILFSIQHRANVLLGTSQEFLISTLSQTEEYLDKRINDLIKDQVKAIDDQKVKLKKRKGVLSFVRIFPLFVKTIEAQLPGQAANGLRIRKTIDDHYATINSHIFQSLKAIAKDSGISGMGSQKPAGLQGATDAEDKEILNYHILLIENTHHYLEDVPEGTNYALDAGRDTAKKEFDEHLNLYVSAILRRPLGKLSDFIESTEGLIKSANDGPSSIANRASHSRSVFKRILSSYDSREISKGIESLKKRVNKHYAEADEAVISQTLIAKVLRECSDRYLDLHERTVAVVKDVYEGSLEVEFKPEDVSSAFRRG